VPKFLLVIHYLSSSIVAMAVSCVVFAIKLDIGRKSKYPKFHTPFHLTCTILEFLRFPPEM